MNARPVIAWTGFVAACVIVLAAMVGAIDMREQSYIDQIDPTVYAADTPVTTSAAETSVLPSPSPTVPNPTTNAPGGANVVEVPEVSAAPLVARQSTVTDGPPPAPPVPAAGDCDAWADVFRHHGATDIEVAFFVPRIIERESGCGRDTLNDQTGDTGICQVSPVHNRAGYFGRRYFDTGGWLHAIHGLTTRVDTDSPTWAAACLTLYRVCGSGPWTPPYSCSNRRLP